MQVTITQNTFNEKRADSKQVYSSLNRPKTSRNRSTDDCRDSSAGDSSNTNDNVRIKSRKSYTINTKSPTPRHARPRWPSEKQAQSVIATIIEGRNLI
jgi:hypothetical protein